MLTNYLCKHITQLIISLEIDNIYPIMIDYRLVFTKRNITNSCLKAMVLVLRSPTLRIDKTANSPVNVAYLPAIV